MNIYNNISGNACMISLKMRLSKYSFEKVLCIFYLILKKLFVFWLWQYEGYIRKVWSKKDMWTIFRVQFFIEFIISFFCYSSHIFYFYNSWELLSCTRRYLKGDKWVNCNKYIFFDVYLFIFFNNFSVCNLFPYLIRFLRNVEIPE